MRTQHPVPGGRIFFIFSLFIFTVFLVSARQQGETEVRPALSANLVVKPGTVVATGIKVSNTATQKRSYESRLVLPQGWKAVTQDIPFELQPAESDVRLVSFSIPADAPARNYEISYVVRTTVPSPHEAVGKIVVVVVSVIDLELKLLNAPRFAVLGSTFPTDFLLTNRGNSMATVLLRFRSSQNFSVQSDSSILHLSPREARQVRANTKTDPNLGKVSHTLELEAISVQDSMIRSKVSSVVEVVPRSNKVEEEFLEYPVSVRVREVGENGKFAAQGEVFGYGSLSEKGTDRLEFLFRGPETQTTSILGQRDEYHLSYRTKEFEVYGGDLNYSLSTLTEVGRYATGAGGRATVGGLSVGGFYNETRWYVPSQKETAGFINYDVLKNATLGVNYLTKREQFSSDITTVRGLISPMEGSNLDLEYGTSKKDGKQDAAYAVRFNGNRQWIAYDARYVHAGADFGGYYRDVDFYSASVNVQPIRNVNVQAFASQDRRNLAKDSVQILSIDTIRVNAPRNSLYQAGIGYSDYFSVNFRRSTQQDLLENPTFRRIDDAVLTRLGYNFRDVNLSANIDLGTTRDELLGKESPYKRLALYAGFRPVGNQNYSTSFEYMTDRNLFSDEQEERLSASLNAWILLGKATNLQVNMYGSRVNSSSEQTYSLIEAAIEHTFPFHHKITLRARQNVVIPASTSREVAYALEYSIPVAIPVKRITAVGQIRGMITDEKGNGVSNALINIGEDASVSTSSGAFVFSALKPGTLYLTVDKASIGLDKITTQPIPMELNIRGGEVTNLAIVITRSVTVSGTIDLWGTKEASLGDTSTAFLDLGGKAGVFLELSNGTELHRRVTDNRGRFLFADIRPGTWVLKVTGGDIPEYHFIEPDTLQLVIRPGEKREVAIQLKPRKRTIKILQEGGVIQEKPAPVEKKTALVDTSKKKEQQKVVQPSPFPCIVRYDILKKGFTLQICSWVTKSKARSVAALAEKITGFKARVQRAKIRSLGVRYRVFLGIFKDVKTAEAVCMELESIR